MAFLYVTEYKRFGRDDRGHTISAPQTPAVTDDKVAVGVGSLNSNAFNDKTRLVELHCDVICHIAWSTQTQVKGGAQVAATIAFKRLPADTTQFFTVGPGESVAVIEGT